MQFFLPLLRTARCCSAAGASTSYAACLNAPWRGMYGEAVASSGSSSSLQGGSGLPSREHVEAELARLGNHLRRTSNMDGSKRLQLSTNVFRVPVPEHEVEQGLMSMDVHMRPECGSTSSKWLRRTQRIPGRVMGMPDNKSIMVHMHENDANKLVRTYGVRGCEAQVVALRIVDPDEPQTQLATVRVKPQQVRQNAVNLRLENIDFLYVPRSRRVRVNVPVRLANSDAAAGVRKGGWLHMFKRTVEYECLGDSIPPCIEVDVKALELDGEVCVRDLAIPARTRLLAQNDEWNDVVVRCTTQGGDEVHVK